MKFFEHSSFSSLPAKDLLGISSNHFVFDALVHPNVDLSPAWTHIVNIGPPIAKLSNLLYGYDHIYKLKVFTSSSGEATIYWHRYVYLVIVIKKVEKLTQRLCEYPNKW